MNQEIKTDDELSILKKIKQREDYGFYFDFLKNPFYYFEQKPQFSFLFGIFCAFSALLIVIAFNQFEIEAGFYFKSHFQSAETILLILGLAFFLPYIYFEEKHQKRIEAAEEKLPGFLHGLSNLIAGGLTLQEALTEISKDVNNHKNPAKNPNRGMKVSFFEDEIHLIGLKMRSGIAFDSCLEDFGKRYDSKLIERAASVISAAEKSGGLMHLSIDAAVFDIQENVNLKKERDSKQSVYGIVLLISFLLFIGIAVLLIRQFNSMNLLAAQPDSFATAAESSTLIYHMLLIQAFFAGLMIGKLQKGKAAAGLKYSFLMLIIVWIAFTAGGVI
ncbi:hypothetical protein [Methanimicrococcus stummii]|nr:hypothetical protein [Methanimicrococcus sp. Es2]